MNLPHEKVYNCVVTCLNILVLSPVVGEWVYHYLFCQGKEYSNGSSPKKNVPKSVLMIMWPNLNLWKFWKFDGPPSSKIGKILKCRHFWDCCTPSDPCWNSTVTLGLIQSYISQIFTKCCPYLTHISSKSRPYFSHLNLVKHFKISYILYCGLSNFWCWSPFTLFFGWLS